MFRSRSAGERAASECLGLLAGLLAGWVWWVGLVQLQCAVCSVQSALKGAEVGGYGYGYGQYSVCRLCGLGTELLVVPDGGCSRRSAKGPQ